MAKNICIFSDGTGQGGIAEGTGNTNVFRLYEACCGMDPSIQVCFYDAGLGARDHGVKKWTRWIHDTLSQATGLGISQNIKDCYDAVIEHYEPGDRIFLFGFSRGAYTVRSLGGVLKLCGVPGRDKEGRSPRTSGETRRELVEEAVEKVYKTYGSTDEQRQKRMSLGAAFRAKYASEEVSPYFIGVWDTVRALGLPGSSSLFGWRHAFHDASLDPRVKFARQALSVDENREVFEPVVWEVTSDDLTTNRVKQVWFAGVHSDIGGGYADDRGLGDLSLTWMINEATLDGLPHRLAIDLDKIAPAMQPSHLGLQHDETFKPLSLWSKKTREAFHNDPFVKWATIDDPSVKDRYKAKSVRCVRGDGPYRPQALSIRPDCREWYGSLASDDEVLEMPIAVNAQRGSIKFEQSGGININRLDDYASRDILAADKIIRTAMIRIIDANFLAGRFAPGEIATLTITIRLPQNIARGKWQSTLTFDPELGPIQIMLEAQGFTLISELPPPFDVPKDKDTTPFAFELRIEEASHRWLHAMLLQKGRLVGELTINDFSAIGQGSVQQTANSAVRSVAEADLMLIVRTAENRIDACSPSDRASLDHVPMKGFRYPEKSFRELLANRLRALYDSRADPIETARELKIVGVELAACLPADLIKLLRRQDIQSVMLRHEEDFDFPLELCYLDHSDDPFFVGDRIAVCRWYLGVTNLPDIVSKKIHRIAFLKGSDEAFRADEILLNRLYPQRTVTFARRSDVVNELLMTSEFDLIHFTGHCRQQDKASGGLELADGSFLRLIEIGQLESERAFAAARPFVMLNACASAQPYLGLTQQDSFAHRFVTSRACAVVGTLWPVERLVANEFAQKFYTELETKPIAKALLAAKLALMNDNVEGDNGATEIPPLRRLARQVAVRSYCLFANPDLRLVS